MWADAAPLPIASPSAEAGASVHGLSALGRRLAALGPVLCLYRRDLARPEQPAGWLPLCGGPVRALCELSSEGPREALRFLDLAGRPLLQVCMLCDSDFLAWEQVLEAPGVQRDPAPSPLCQLPWLARLRWRARLLRLGGGDLAGPNSRGRQVSVAGGRIAADWCRRYGCELGQD